MKSLIIFCLSFYVVFAKHEQYDGHSLYKINVKNMEEHELINQLENQLFLDVWSHAQPGRAGQILVSKDNKEVFETTLGAYGIDYSIEVNNIKELIDIEDRMLESAAARSRGNVSRMAFDRIYTYDEINAYIEDLAKRNPYVTLVNGGRSFEGRPINYLRISTTDFQDSRKPVVMIQSLLHCREWITSPVTLYALNKLVVDVSDSDLLNNIDWIIVPVVNPDGYIWTHNNARFWRKNRRTGNACVGVDLNRNFNSSWGSASSSSSCSDTFHGSGPMSEPESKVIGDIIELYRNRIGLFLDIHSFGSMILYGYGTGVLPPNGLTLNLVAVRMAQAIDRVKWSWKPNYIVGNIAHVLYQASGGASDFAQASGIPLSYTYELPAYNNINWSLNGFLVDPRFIEQAGFETWEGIKAGARYLIGSRKA